MTLIDEKCNKQLKRLLRPSEQSSGLFWLFGCKFFNIKL